MMPGKPAAQLRLFKSPLRPVRGAIGLEFKLHCQVAELVRRIGRPGWRWTHLPFGEYRPPAIARKLKLMGVCPGWADLLFIHESGRVCWLELKRRGQALTPEQRELADFLADAGHEFAAVDNFDDAVSALNAWGIVTTQHQGEPLPWHDIANRTNPRKPTAGSATTGSIRRSRAATSTRSSG